jgi:hypothetical protein
MMAISITLDANALSSLINSDPEFLFKVQQAALSEVSKRYIKGIEEKKIVGILSGIQSSIKGEIEKELREKYGERLAGGWSNQVELRPEFKHQIHDQVT